MPLNPVQDPLPLPNISGHWEVISTSFSDSASGPMVYFKRGDVVIACRMNCAYKVSVTDDNDTIMADLGNAESISFSGPH